VGESQENGNITQTFPTQTLVTKDNLQKIRKHDDRNPQIVITTMLVSSIHASSISSVNTLETLRRSSPPIARRSSLSAILSSVDHGRESVSVTGGRTRDIEYAQDAIMYFSLSLEVEGGRASEQISENPSDARMRNFGSGFTVCGSAEREGQKRFLAKFANVLVIELSTWPTLIVNVDPVNSLSSLLWMIWGSAVIYGGVIFLTKNSSHGDV